MSPTANRLTASVLFAAAGIAHAQSGGSADSTASTDPYVQKRDADAAANKEYKAKKKMAKAEYKKEQSAAKSDMKSEKKEASAERKSSLASDPTTTQVPGSPSNLKGN